MACRDTEQHAYASVSMAPESDAELRRLTFLAWLAYYESKERWMTDDRGIRTNAGRESSIIHHP
jgi:hypothetical protein